MKKAQGRREVFIVIGSLNIGGAEMHVSAVAPELVKRGYAVSVYNLSGEGVLGKTLAKGGVKLITPPITCSQCRLSLLKYPLLCLSAIKLFLIFLFARPSIVHFYLPQAYIIGTVLGRFAGLPYLIMSRRSLNNYQKRHPILGRIEPKLHAWMDIILGNSKRVIEQLRDEEKVPEEKLKLIYNGIDTERYNNPFNRTRKRQTLGITPDTLVLVVVANLIPYKGHTDILHALSKIKNKLPQDWLLLVAGRDDGIGKSLKQLSVSKKLDGHIRFLDARDDVPDLLRVSDIGLLCSHEEGFSNVILEGMAAGLPMIVTDVGGNAEAVVDGKTGIIVPPHAPAKIGAAIMRLANDAQLAKQMGRKGKQRAKRLFSLEKCVSAYEAVYDAMYATYTSHKGSQLRSASKM